MKRNFCDPASQDAANFLPRRSPPGVNYRGGLTAASGFSPVPLLKRGEVAQTVIDCIAVVFAALFFVITSLGTVAALAVLLFFSVH